MKKMILSCIISFLFSNAFPQNIESTKTNSQNPINIIVPDFADPEVRKFYYEYSNHLVKCVEAIRQKDEAKVTGLFKNPGEQLVAREKILAVKVVKNAGEKQKYMKFAAQVYPYIKEVEQSAYYQKLYGNSH